MSATVTEPHDESPRRRWWRRVPRRGVLFVLVLGSVAGAKYSHNAWELAYARSLPHRLQLQAERYARMREEFRPTRDMYVEAPFEEFRAAVDPDGRANLYPRWSMRPNGREGVDYAFRDVAHDRTLKANVVRGRVNAAWVASEPYEDAPVPFWAAGEWARNAVGIVAGLAWVAAAIGAYREPLLRRRLGGWALACGLVALAAWSLEPPPEIRAKGFRVPLGPYVGGALVLLSLPPLVWARRAGASRGRCQHCGYDLTGNVSGVCPECGEPTPAEARRRRRERAAVFATALEGGVGAAGVTTAVADEPADWTAKPQAAEEGARV